VVRWLAATSALGAGVELTGVDMNATLVGRIWYRRATQTPTPA
jgi:hypothetical protein